MRDPEFHLQALAASVESLQPYLLSKDVFWPMGPLPSLSLGRIYWDRTVLSARKALLKGPQLADLGRIERTVEDLQRQWSLAWENKATAELRTRINLWQAYLRELDDSRDEAGAYPQEVRNRALAAHLRRVAGNQPEARQLGALLDGLDARLRSVFKAGEFVWEPELAPAFPIDPYWYLYGRPSGN